jgi:hypothetical protein
MSLNLTPILAVLVELLLEMLLLLLIWSTIALRCYHFSANFVLRDLVAIVRSFRGLLTLKPKLAAILALPIHLRFFIHASFIKVLSLSNYVVLLNSLLCFEVFKQSIGTRVSIKLIGVVYSALASLSVVHRQLRHVLGAVGQINVAA